MARRECPFNLHPAQNYGAFLWARLGERVLPCLSRTWASTVNSDLDSRTRYPKITVVTPSFNQGDFLEETICSVLEQEYKNLEYIIIDGGSTDRSLDVIRQHEKDIDFWISEPDNGQSHAINKGFGRSTGDILAWLNSDDIYMPGCLKEVANYFMQHPDSEVAVGGCCLFEATRNLKRGGDNIRFPSEADPRLLVWPRDYFCQQSTFWRRALWDDVGALREDLHYAMDYDLWCRMARVSQFGIIDQVLAAYRFHDSAKCVAHTEETFRELLLVAANYASSDLVAQIASYMLDHYSKRCAGLETQVRVFSQLKSVRIGTSLRRKWLQILGK